MLFQRTNAIGAFVEQSDLSATNERDDFDFVTIR